MIVDTSAIVAVATDEAEASAFAGIFRNARGGLAISAGNYFEAAIVLDSVRFSSMAHRLDQVVEAADMEIAPVTALHAKLARQAYREFGKGSGHPAQLNFGDCFAYALAKDRDEPLLFKGNDFTHTDVKSAS